MAYCEPKHLMTAPSSVATTTAYTDTTIKAFPASIMKSILANPLRQDCLRSTSSPPLLLIHHSRLLNGRVTYYDTTKVNELRGELLGPG